MVSHCPDRRLKAFCYHIDMVVYFWLVCFIAKNCFAEMNGGVNLVGRRMLSFVKVHLDSFDLKDLRISRAFIVCIFSCCWAVGSADLWPAGPTNSLEQRPGACFCPPGMLK